jgi:hypothetical protein
LQVVPGKHTDGDQYSVFVPGPLASAVTLGGPSPFLVEFGTVNPGAVRQVVAGLPGCATVLWASSVVVLWPEPLVVVTGDATFGASIQGTTVPHVLMALVRLARGSPPRVLNCGPAPCSAGASPPAVIAIDNKCCPTTLFVAGPLVLGDHADDAAAAAAEAPVALPGSIRFNAAIGAFEGCVDASGTWLPFAFALGARP